MLILCKKARINLVLILHRCQQKQDVCYTLDRTCLGGYRAVFFWSNMNHMLHCSQYAGMIHGYIVIRVYFLLYYIFAVFFGL